ncbi:MAG: polysaccharide deacetylase family protein [Leptotrichiaceae bacterium]|nr:polysaccharide deacetylase family protein [Leptotrichiaceae bacterium]
MYFLFLLFILSVIYYFFRKRKSLICLMYHNVFPEETEGIISKEQFEKHMDYIKNIKTYKMEELEKINYTFDKNSILVTFDDGYKNNYTEAFPVLKKYNIKATIFLNTKYIGKDKDYLNWEQIKEMYNSGLVDFQMHTHSHYPIIRKTEIKGFFGKNESDFVKREYFSIFRDGFSESEKDKIKDFRDFDFEEMPVFKTRSRIAIKGFQLKKDFIEKYREITDTEKFRKMSLNNKKKFLNELFKLRKDEFFKKVTTKEFNERTEFEIKENKRQIEENLKKKTEYLAYPWGHKYGGDIEVLEKLGVKGFVMTSGGKNSRKLNYKKILRINGDKIKDYNLFIKKMKEKF